MYFSIEIVFFLLDILGNIKYIDNLWLFSLEMLFKSRGRFIIS